MTKKQTDLKKLTAKWYKKLAKEGFVDIEQDEDHLKQWDSLYFLSRYQVAASDARYTAQVEYYQLAGQFLHEHSFASPTEKLIWQLHSDGVTNAGIYKELVKRGRKMYQDGINAIVNKLKKQMVPTCQRKKT